MPTTYATADDDVTEFLADVMRRYHPPLFDAAVRVGVLMAASDTGDAVTHGGYPALATIKVISLRDRVHKQIDAELVIDRRKWDELPRASQEAVLDHELSHIALKEFGYAPVLDADGKPTGETDIRFERDDLDRPKLVTVKGDWNTGDGFAAVIRRHGRSAVEFLNIEAARRNAERALEGDI
jgi:hypothetical protein